MNAALKWMCCALSLLLATGCDRKAKESSAALDSVLSTGRVNRLMVVENYAVITNQVAEQHASSVLAALQPTNRVPYTFWHKSYVSADLFLYHDDKLFFSLGISRASVCLTTCTISSL